MGNVEEEEEEEEEENQILSSVSIEVDSELLRLVHLPCKEKENLSVYYDLILEPQKPNDNKYIHHNKQTVNDRPLSI